MSRQELRKCLLAILLTISEERGLMADQRALKDFAKGTGAKPEDMEKVMLALAPLVDKP